MPSCEAKVHITPQKQFHFSYLTLDVFASAVVMPLSVH